MGNMAMMETGDWKVEKMQQLGLGSRQEVLAVIRWADVVAVGDICDQDLELCLEVVNGRSKGRQIITHMPVWDRKGHLAVTARANVLSLCRAVGFGDDIPSDSSAFVGKALKLRLRRVRGEQHHPQADYVACSEAERKAVEEETRPAAQGEQEPETGAAKASARTSAKRRLW